MSETPEPVPSTVYRGAAYHPAMTGARDEYYNRAKQEGYRARSAYKLKQIDDDADLLSRGDAVVDLGCAPGSWLQVAVERVDAPDAGTVVGVDLQGIESVDGATAIRGDVTEDETIERVRGELDGPADVVVSDAAPDLSGDWNLDHSRSVHLARSALAAAEALLRPGGDLLVKVFQGDTLEEFREELEAVFDEVWTLKPDASRDESSEVYLLGRGLVDAPVSEGDELTVTIDDEGDEGDGVASVDGYVLFVPGAGEGDVVDVEVTEVGPRFGRAEPR